MADKNGKVRQLECLPTFRYNNKTLLTTLAQHGAYDKLCLHFAAPRIRGDLISGQSYKASTFVNYDSRVVNLSNLLVSTTLK